MKLSNVQYTESMQSFIESLNPNRYAKLQEYINTRINQYNATTYDDGESNVTHFSIPSGTMIIEFMSKKALNTFRIDYKRDPSFPEILHNLKKACEHFQSFYENVRQSSFNNCDIVYAQFNQLKEEFGDGRGMTIDDGEFGMTDIMDFMHNLYIMLESQKEYANVRAAERLDEMFIARTTHKMMKRSDSECTT